LPSRKLILRSGYGLLEEGGTLPDRRPIDQVSTEELERILAIRKRKERAQRLRRLAVQGRVAPVDPFAQAPEPDGNVPAFDTRGRPTGRYRAIEVGGEEELREERPRHGLAWGWLLNKALLIVEIVALGGIILIALNLLTLRSELNQSASQALATPTAAPKPLIDVVVLPSGHRPPTVPGGDAAPNPDEIPEHLRSRVQAITPQPIPTQGPEQPTRIVVKSIGVDAPIVQGDSWEQLKKGVGHHLGTANPGERGNMVLSAHNDVYGEIFRYLEKVEPKDEILVYSGSRLFRYVVTQRRIIEPTEVGVMYPTSDPTATLITCYPYLVDNKRVVVIAELQP
jgi:sortase A